MVNEKGKPQAVGALLEKDGGQAVAGNDRGR